MTAQEGLFDVALPDAVDWPDRPRMLLSYAYAKKRTADEVRELLDGADLIVDSGAFTALSSGKPIEHEEYLDWLVANGTALGIRFAFSLDVIGDPEASLANYLAGREYLGDRVRLVPAWHIGSSWTALTELCKLTDYVAVGGAVPYAKTPELLFRLCRHAHELAAEQGARVHGLGITGRRVMYQLPWTSVDSSSWNMFGRFSAFSLAEQNGRLTAINYGQGALPAEHWDLVLKYGLDPSRMHEQGYGATGWASTEENLTLRATNRQASARSFMYAEVVKRNTHPDFRLYLACDATDNRELRMVNAAHALGNPWASTTTTTEEVA